MGKKELLASHEALKREVIEANAVLKDFDEQHVAIYQQRQELSNVVHKALEVFEQHPLKDVSMRDCKGCDKRFYVVFAHTDKEVVFTSEELETLGITWVMLTKTGLRYAYCFEHEEYFRNEYYKEHGQWPPRKESP